jgi:hypothetical protein
MAVTGDAMVDTAATGNGDIDRANTTHGNGNINCAKTTQMAVADDAVVDTAEAIGNSIVARNTVDAIKNQGKTPTPNSSAGAVDVLVWVSVNMCTFYYENQISSYLMTNYSQPE